MDLIHDEHILQGIVSFKTQVKEIKEAEYVEDMNELSKAYGIIRTVISFVFTWLRCNRGFFLIITCIFLTRDS
jgi:hypothetical protein